MKNYTEVGCRQFNPNETLKQICFINPHLHLCWGMSNKIVVYGKDEYNEVKGMMFKVKGHHWKKYVLITLNFADYYDVHLVNNDGQVVEEVSTDVPFEELSRIIDNRIEKLAHYTN